MKTFIIFVAALFCVQAVKLPIIISGSSESSEEEISILVPIKGQPLPGVGVIEQPVLQAVKIKIPRYANAKIRQQLINAALAAKGINPQDVASGGRGVRQVAGTTVANKVVSETTTVASDSEISAETVVPPVVGGAAKAPEVEVKKSN